MPDQVDIYKARIAQLEDELATARAEAKASAIMTDTQVQDIERKHLALSSDYATLQKESKQLQEHVHLLCQERSKLQESQQTLTTQLRETEVKLNETEQSLHSANLARATLTNALDSLRKSYDQQTEQLAEAHTAVARLQQEKLETIGHMRQVEDSAKAQSTELERLRSMEAILEEQIQRAKERFDASNREIMEAAKTATDRSRKLQNQLDDANADLTRLRESDRTARMRAQTLAVELASCQERLIEKENTYEQLETNLMAQLASAQEEAKSVRDALVKTENARVLAARELAQCKQQLADMEESADKALEDLRAQLEYMQQQLAAALNAPGAGLGLQATPRMRAGVSPSPLPGGSMLLAGHSSAQLVGKSMEDVANMYDEMVDLARAEHAARIEMERQVDELCSRIQRKVMDMNAAAEELHQLRGTHKAATEELKELHVQVQILEGQLSGQEVETEALQRQLDGYKQALADKEHQLTVLLAEVERLHGRQVPQANPGPVAAGAALGIIDAPAMITRDLVSFTSLAEAVQQNSALLAIARELGMEVEKSKDQLEEKYKKQWEAEHKKMIADTEVLRQVVSRVQADAERHQHQAHQGSPHSGPSSACVRDQQHQHRREASPGPEAAARAAALAQELEQVKQSLAEAQKTLEDTRTDGEGLITKLREELQALRQEAVGLRHQAAAASAGAEHHKKQAEMATMLAEEVKAQNAMLAEQLQKDRAARDRTDIQVGELTHQLQLARNANHKLDLEGSQLKVQLAHYEASYTKLQEQLSEMSARFTEEHAKCATLTAQVNERKASAARENERLEAQLDSKARELDAVRQELLELRAKESNQAAMAVKLAEDTRAENTGLKASLAAAEQRKSELEATIRNLQEQLKSAQDKAADLEQQLASRSVPEPGLGESTTARELRIARNELKEHKMEIIGLTEQLKAAELSRDSFKATCNRAIETSKSIQGTLDVFREQHEAALLEAAATQKDLQERLDQAAKQVEELNTKLANAIQAVEAAKSEVEKEKARADAIEAGQEQKFAGLVEEVEALNAKMAVLATDCAEATRRYSQEVVAHGRDIERLDTAEARVTDLLKQLGAAQGAIRAKEAAHKHAEDALKNLEKEAGETKQKLEVQLKVKESEVEALRSQLEALAEDLPEGQRPRTEAGEDVLELLFRTQTENRRYQAEIAHLNGAMLLKEREYNSYKMETAELRVQIKKLIEEGQDAQVRKPEHMDQIHQLQHELAEKSTTISMYHNQIEVLRKQAIDAQARLKELQGQVAPMQSRYSMMEAEVSALKLNNEQLEVECKRWEEQATRLQSKYGKVDLEEYQRVRKLLAEAEKELQSAKENIQQQVQQAQLEMQQQQQQQLEAAKREADKELDGVKAQRDKWSKQVKQLRQDLLKQKNAATELRSKLDEAEGRAKAAAAESAAATCTQDDTTQKLRNSLEIAKRNNEILLKNQDIIKKKQLRAEETAQKMSDNAASATSNLQAVQQQLEDVKQQLSKKETEVEELKKQAASTSLDTGAKLKQLQQQLNDQLKQLEECRQRQAEAIQQQESKWKQENGKLRQQLETKEQQLQAAQAAVASAAVAAGGGRGRAPLKPKQPLPALQAAAPPLLPPPVPGRFAGVKQEAQEQQQVAITQEQQQTPMKQEKQQVPVKQEPERSAGRVVQQQQPAAAAVEQGKQLKKAGLRVVAKPFTPTSSAATSARSTDKTEAEAAEGAAPLAATAPPAAQAPAAIAIRAQVAAIVAPAAEASAAAAPAPEAPAAAASPVVAPAAVQEGAGAGGWPDSRAGAAPAALPMDGKDADALWKQRLKAQRQQKKRKATTPPSEPAAAAPPQESSSGDGTQVGLQQETQNQAPVAKRVRVRENAEVQAAAVQGAMEGQGEQQQVDMAQQQRTQQEQQMEVVPEGQLAAGDAVLQVMDEGAGADGAGEALGGIADGEAPAGSGGAGADEDGGVVDLSKSDDEELQQEGNEQIAVPKEGTQQQEQQQQPQQEEEQQQEGAEQAGDGGEQEEVDNLEGDVEMEDQADVGTPRQEEEVKVEDLLVEVDENGQPQQQQEQEEQEEQLEEEGPAEGGEGEGGVVVLDGTEKMANLEMQQADMERQEEEQRAEQERQEEEEQAAWEMQEEEEQRAEQEMQEEEQGAEQEGQKEGVVGEDADMEEAQEEAEEEEELEEQQQLEEEAKEAVAGGSGDEEEAELEQEAEEVGEGDLDTEGRTEEEEEEEDQEGAERQEDNDEVSAGQGGEEEESRQEGEQQQQGTQDGVEDEDLLQTLVDEDEEGEVIPVATTSTQPGQAAEDDDGEREDGEGADEDGEVQAVSGDGDEEVAETEDMQGDDGGAFEQQVEVEEEIALSDEEGELPATEEPERTPPPPAVAAPASTTATEERKAPATAPPAARPAADVSKVTAATSADPGVRTSARVTKAPGGGPGQAAVGAGRGGGAAAQASPGGGEQAGTGRAAGGSQGKDGAGAGAGKGNKRHAPIVWPGKEEKRVSGGGEGTEAAAGSAPAAPVPPVRTIGGRSPPGVPAGMQQQRRGPAVAPTPGAGIPGGHPRVMGQGQLQPRGGGRGGRQQGKRR